MTSPVEELRTAAAKIRELASNATPGPWHIYTDHEDDSFDLFWVHCEDHGPVTADMNEGGVCIERADDEGGWPDAVWIALMSPVFAGPIAEWLEAVADKEALLGGPANEDLAALALHPFGYEHALAVARVINGAAV